MPRENGKMGDLMDRLTLPAIYTLAATVALHVGACLAIGPSWGFSGSNDAYSRWREMQPPNLPPIVSPEEVGVSREAARLSGIRFNFAEEVSAILPEASTVVDSK